jgi:RHS repeat-associated protein
MEAVFVWDGENRLVTVKDKSTNAVIVSYTYDSQSRRVARTQGSNVTLYLYDGWNCIGDYVLHTSSFNLHTSFSWGLDLSGSLQGAGGVGGLLATTKFPLPVGDGQGEGQSTDFYPCFDGNGNISEYLTATGSIAAHYEYDPFGRTTVASGLNAGDFEYRFSTKPVDAATGLYYYGFRYFDPSTGRWISRDPSAEQGGANIYGFVGNNGIDMKDLLGLWEVMDVLKILCCPEYRDKVEMLAKLKIIAFRETNEKWLITGEVFGQELRWVQERKGTTKGFVPLNDQTTIFVDNALDAKTAAQTLVHELVHTRQDPKMDKIEAEVEAHATELQFQLDKGMPVPENRKDWVQNGKIDKDVIRAYLINHPKYSPPKGVTRIGVDVKGAIFKVGWDCTGVVANP